MRAPEGTLRYWLRSLWSEGILGGDEAPAPRVTAVWSDGVEVTMLRTGSYRQAVQQARRFSAELDRMGMMDFCKKYALSR